MEDDPLHPSFPDKAFESALQEQFSKRPTLQDIARTYFYEGYSPRLSWGAIEAAEIERAADFAISVLRHRNLI